MTFSTHAQLSSPAMRKDGCPLVGRWSAGNAHYRWTLTRAFEGPLALTPPAPTSEVRARFLPWLMLNPSDADHLREDPTLRRVMLFSWCWGFAGCLLLNVYPYRTPSPAALARIVVGWDERGAWDVRDTIWENHSRVKAELKPYDAVMVAWGSQSGRLGQETDAWANNLFEEIDNERDEPIRRWCLGRTKSGDPIHPMARGRSRVPDGVLPQRWLSGGWA